MCWLYAFPHWLFTISVIKLFPLSQTCVSPSASQHFFYLSFSFSELLVFYYLCWIFKIDTVGNEKLRCGFQVRNNRVSCSPNDPNLKKRLTSCMNVFLFSISTIDTNADNWCLTNLKDEFPLSFILLNTVCPANKCTENMLILLNYYLIATYLIWGGYSFLFHFTLYFLSMLEQMNWTKWGRNTWMVLPIWQLLLMEAIGSFWSL